MKLQQILPEKFFSIILTACFPFSTSWLESSFNEAGLHVAVKLNCFVSGPTNVNSNKLATVRILNGTSLVV